MTLTLSLAWAIQKFYVEWRKRNLISPKFKNKEEYEKSKTEKVKTDNKAVLSITGFKGEEQLEEIILFLQRNIARFVLVLGIILIALRIIFPVYGNDHYAVTKGYLSQEEAYRLGLESVDYITDFKPVRESQEETYRLGLETPRDLLAPAKPRNMGFVKDYTTTLLQSLGIAVITAFILAFLNKKIRETIIRFVKTLTSFIKRNVTDVVLTIGSILIALRLFFLPDVNQGRYATALLQAIGIAVITGIIFYLLKKKRKTEIANDETKKGKG